eukprot:g1649.t1
MASADMVAETTLRRVASMHKLLTAFGPGEMVDGIRNGHILRTDWGIFQETPGESAVFGFTTLGLIASARRLLLRDVCDRLKIPDILASAKAEETATAGVMAKRLDCPDSAFCVFRGQSAACTMAKELDPEKWGQMTNLVAGASLC